MTKALNDSRNASTKEKLLSIQFADSILATSRQFVEALLSDDAFTEALLERLDTYHRPQTYLSIEQDMAKVLYAILKLQHQFLVQPTNGESKGNFPQANRKNIVTYSGLTDDQVRMILSQLTSARYILLGNLRRSKAKGSPGGEGLEIFEPRVDVMVSCADTAVVLLNLLEKSIEHVQRGPICQYEGRLLDQEIDGKVNRSSFVDALLAENKLAYFSRQDLLGDGQHKGKLDELADAGEYIERVSTTHIRPRMRIALERTYLFLVAQQVPIEKLRLYNWDGTEWILDQPLLKLN